MRYLTQTAILVVMFVFLLCIYSSNLLVEQSNLVRHAASVKAAELTASKTSNDFHVSINKTAWEFTALPPMQILGLYQRNDEVAANALRATIQARGYVEYTCEFGWVFWDLTPRLHV